MSPAAMAEKISSVFDEFLRQPGRECRVLQVFAIDQVVHGHQPVQIYRPGHAVQVALLEPEHIEQKRGQVVRAVVRNFEANGRTIATGDQLALQCPHQVVDFFVVDVEIAVARYAKLIAAGDLHAGEQFFDEGMNDGR